MVFLDKGGQQFPGRHTFRHVIHLVNDFQDASGLLEQVFGMDETDDVVDTPVVDQQSRKLRFDETSGRFFDRTVLFDRFDVDAGNHAVAHQPVGKVERVLEQADVFFVLLLFGAVRDFVQQVGQIHFVERVDPLFAVQRQPEDFEDTHRDQSRQFSDRIEQQVEKVDRDCKVFIVEIRVQVYDRLRDEFGREDDDQRRYQRFDHVGRAVAEDQSAPDEQQLDQYAHLQ